MKLSERIRNWWSEDCGRKHQKVLNVWADEVAELEAELAAFEITLHGFLVGLGKEGPEIDEMIGQIRNTLKGLN